MKYRKKFAIAGIFLILRLFFPHNNFTSYNENLCRKFGEKGKRKTTSIKSNPEDYVQVKNGHFYYIGKRYAEEETIAFYQLEDEMEFLSWPPKRIDNKDNLFQILIKKKWEKYLKGKYRNTENLKKAWGCLFENENINDMKAIFYPGARFRKTPEIGKIKRK